MSELQAALLAIGFGVIVAVYVFGWWQQRKYRRKFGTAFKASHADALYREKAAVAVEHTLQAAPVDTNDDSADEPITAADQAVQPSAAEQSDRNLPGDSCALLEASSDFIIELHLAEPCPANALDGLWQRKFDFGKPVQVCGMALNSLQWERAIAESQTLYERFRIALQLVDRGGAISAAKLADFRDLVLGVAKHIKADAAAADIHETHHRAVELDKFCAEVDQTIGINLVPPGERLLTGTKIAQAAALHGMTLEADGAFHLLDAQGHSLFSLVNQDANPFQHHTLGAFGTAGITLLLDVPRTENPAEQFSGMARIARELGKELQVNLVDDNRVALIDPALAVIREQVTQVEAKMRANGIVPGSAQARRLFA